MYKKEESQLTINCSQLKMKLADGKNVLQSVSFQKTKSLRTKTNLSGNIFSMD